MPCNKETLSNQYKSFPKIVGFRFLMFHVPDTLYAAAYSYALQWHS